MPLLFESSNKRCKLWTEFIRIYSASFQFAAQHYRYFLLTYLASKYTEAGLHFVRTLISKTTRPNFTEFYLHVIYDHNTVWIFLLLIGGFSISLILIKLHKIC